MSRDFRPQLTDSRLDKQEVITAATLKPGPEVIKLFSCSTQMSMKVFVLINLKLLTMPNSFLLNIAGHENFSANKYENANYCWHFRIF